MPARKNEELTRGNKAEKTRKKLLLRAAGLFAKNGYEGVGLQEIAEVAGLTKGSLYYHFESKQHIYIDAVSFVIGAAFETANLPAFTGTPDAQMDQYLEWILSVMKNNPLARRLLIHMMMDHDTSLLDQLMKGPLGESLNIFLKILAKLHVKKDKTVLAFFTYCVLSMKHELAYFTETWLPNLDVKLGGNQTAEYLKAMIKAW